jgi:hypothetical protein
MASRIMLSPGSKSSVGFRTLWLPYHTQTATVDA